jgi:hypothetical protein
MALQLAAPATIQPSMVGISKVVHADSESTAEPDEHRVD